MFRCRDGPDPSVIQVYLKRKKLSTRIRAGTLGPSTSPFSIRSRRGTVSRERVDGYGRVGRVRGLQQRRVSEDDVLQSVESGVSLESNDTYLVPLPPIPTLSP